MKIKFRFAQSSMKILRGKFKFFSLGALLFFSTLNAFAEEATPPAPESRETNWEEALIQGNINISEWFDSFADGLDLFLVGKRVTKRQNQTRINIETSFVTTEIEPFSSAANLGFNLQLPNVEEYWSLKFSSYDEQQEQRNLKNAYLRTTPRQKSYGATVGLLANLGKVRTRFEPRIELQDPLKVSHSLTFDSIAKTKHFEINPELELYANSDVGVGSVQSLNFYFRFTNIYSMTLLNQGNYEEKSHFYNVDNGISFGQVIDGSSGLSYNLIFNSNNRAHYHLESYNISLSYSKVLYKRILDFQLIPNVDFAEDLGFKGVAGLTLNINLQF
ncbi:hypothetical protein [Bdellovibrio sp. HCB2-146]|uniref:hypothetical protein n=1 Tax=Bdellovibrio sp. HCB2-146 TaxID=3394362 RepID=UPI0039BD4C07